MQIMQKQDWLSATSCDLDADGMPLEDCLVRQELVVLPQSGALTMPLSEGSCLVGLLVVEVDGGSGLVPGAAAAAAAAAVAPKQAQPLLPEMAQAKGEHGVVQQAPV